jgi:arylsulfatase A-like enzyme
VANSLARGIVRYVIAALLLACSTRSGSSDPRGAPTGSASNSGTYAVATSAQAAGAAPRKVLLDFIALPQGCSAGHRGVLIDFGDLTSPATKIATGKRGAIEPVEHEGATWLRVTGRGTTVAFSGSPDGFMGGKMTVEARLRGGGARAATFVLNGKSLGALALAKGVTRVSQFETEAAQVQPFANQLSIVFSGGPAKSDVAGEIDWVRIGPSDTLGPLAPPTRNDIVQSVVMSGERKRALTLREPGYVRCSMLPAKNARFESRVAISGEGEADIELRATRDRAGTQILASAHVVSGEEAKPVALAATLPDSDEVVDLALVVTHATKGVRVAVAEPRVFAEPAAAQVVVAPQAKSIVVVVLSSVARNTLSPYGGPNEMPELGALASGGIVFDNHRASSGYANASVMSALSGLSPEAHGIRAPRDSVRIATTSLAGVLKKAGIQTAFFSANPGTFPPFGIGRDFDETKYYDPADGTVSASRPFEDAARWLNAHNGERTFAVIHARAGHPPWDATREELKELPPANYSGVFDPRAAGEFLARARRPHSTAKLTDPDRVRLWALYALALKTHDASLGGLVANTRQQNRDDETMYIVAGDIGIDVSAVFPFDEGPALREPAMALPLIVRPPGGHTASRVSAATTSADIAATVLHSFALDTPASMTGVSLWNSAFGTPQPQSRMLAALSENDVAYRWGKYVYYTNKEAPRRLCKEDIDPVCAEDLRATLPIATTHLSMLAQSRTGAAMTGDDAKPSPAAPIDYGAALSLKVWGHVSQ